MKMKITKRQCFWSAAAVLYVLFIFSNSMKNADLSSADSGAVLRLVQQVLAAGGVDGTIITEHVIRKTAHFTEYAALGILLCLCFRTYVLPLHSRVLSQVLAGLLVPFADETIQLFVAGRSGQISDVWLDCAGVAFGTILFAAAAWIVSRTGAKKRDKKLQNSTSV